MPPSAFSPPHRFSALMVIVPDTVCSPDHAVFSPPRISNSASIGPRPQPKCSSNRYQ
jgi:hypothetical protein